MTNFITYITIIRFQKKRW